MCNKSIKYYLFGPFFFLMFKQFQFAKVKNGIIYYDYFVLIFYKLGN